MAVIFMDGFDHYSNNTSDGSEILSNGWSTQFNLDGTVAATRFAISPGRMMRGLSSTTMYFSKDDYTAMANMTVGFAWLGNVESNPATAGNFILFYEGASLIARVEIDASRKIVLRDNADAIQATSTSILASDTWYYIEVSLNSHASTGSINAFVDGTEWCSATGLDTGTGAVTKIYHQPADNFYIDDYYVTDDLTKLDAPRIVTLLPTGDSATNTDWTGDYTNVDDAGGSATRAVMDSTYANTSTATDKEGWTYPSLPTGTWTIHAVTAATRAQNSDSGTPTYKVSCTGGASTTGIVTGSSFEHNKDVWMDENGSTGGWTQAEVDALEVTVEYEV